MAGRPIEALELISQYRSLHRIDYSGNLERIAIADAGDWANTGCGIRIARLLPHFITWSFT
jgi:hypothetical protein